MYIDILNKIFLFVLVMSSLNVFRHGYYFIQAWFSSSEDNPQKYRMNNSSLWILSMSIAYILTSIFNGVYL